MIDILLDTILDLLKLLPFLYITFVLIELFEDRFSDSTKQIISKTNKVSPVIAALFGLIPQCGFSVMATNLYITHIIPVGTLIAIYLATSDEMLPILISSGADIRTIVSILAIKFVIGGLAGTIIMLLDKRKYQLDYSLCQEDDCDCEDVGPFKAALTHTISIASYLFIITLILNLLIDFIGSEAISSLLLNDSFFALAISGLIGLIPNCAASIIITQLYIQNIICLPVAIAGLLTNSGMAVLVLFKNNKNMKENLLIVLTVYVIAVISGVILEIFI